MKRKIKEKAYILLALSFCQPFQKTLKKLKKFKFLQDEKKLTGILIILYLIPGVPKDVITYIVPLTKVTKKDFFLYVMPFRLPAIMMSTILGTNFGKGNYMAAIVIMCVCVAIGVAGYFLKDPVVNKLKSRKHGVRD